MRTGSAADCSVGVVLQELMKLGALAQPLTVLLVPEMSGSHHHEFTTTTDGLRIEYDRKLDQQFNEITRAWRDIDGLQHKTVNVRDDLDPAPYPALTMRNIIQVLGFESSRRNRERFVKNYLPVRDRHHVRQIELKTRGPNNKYWHQFRYGRILTCHFGRILSFTQQRYKAWEADKVYDLLIQTLLGQRRNRCDKLTRYYKTSFPNACKYYEDLQNAKMTNASRQLTDAGPTNGEPPAAERKNQTQSHKSIECEDAQIAINGAEQQNSGSQRIVTSLKTTTADLSPPTKVGAARHRTRSEERRVGKECRSRWSPYH